MKLNRDALDLLFKLKIKIMHYNIKHCLDRVSNNHKNIKSMRVKATVYFKLQISESVNFMDFPLTQ